MTLVPRPSEAAAAADQLGGVWGCGASPGKVFLGTKLTRIWDILRDDLSAGVCGTMPTSTTDSVRGDDVALLLTAGEDHPFGRLETAPR